MFLQEMHSTVYDEKRWEDKLKEKLFFSHGHIATVAEWLLVS